MWNGRSSNQVADKIAKLTLSQGNLFLFSVFEDSFSNFPSSLLDVVNQDLSGEGLL